MSRKLGSLLSYPAMLAAAALVVTMVERRGSTLAAPSIGDRVNGFGAHAAQASAQPILHILVALVTVIACGKLVGALFLRIGQPPVIGEVISGIMLGPSLLGRLSPAAQAFVLPQDVAPMLGVLAQVGVILYMFIVGLHLDTKVLRGREHTTIAISHASIVLPFTLGAVLALFLYPRVATNDVPFFEFMLFVGVSMSVTAFPVLARILTDRGVHRTRMGIIALTCAAADDVTAWCLLAVIVGVASGTVSAALVTIALAAAYAALMLWVARPFVARWFTDDHAIPFVLVGLLASALATEAIGIHAIFGAFLFGAILPSDSAIAKALVAKLEDVVTTIFLPAFFAYTGMRTQIGLVSGVDAWLMCGLIFVVASLGKFVGTAAAARLTGLSWRDSSALGVLMNTRGLMGLIVLNIGYDMNILSPTLMAMLVITAVATTVMTSPMLSLLTPWDAEPSSEAVSSS